MMWIETKEVLLKLRSTIDSTEETSIDNLDCIEDSYRRFSETFNMESSYLLLITVYRFYMNYHSVETYLEGRKDPNMR